MNHSEINTFVKLKYKIPENYDEYANIVINGKYPLDVVIGILNTWRQTHGSDFQSFREVVINELYKYESRQNE